MEGEILRAVEKHRFAYPGRLTHLEVASRTDRGVSARGNAVALSSPLGGAPLLRVLNGVAPDILFTHARPIDESFRPRSATRRVYRYLEPSEGRDLNRWRELGRSLEGPLDARSFGRGLPDREPVWRTVDRIRVEPDGGWFVLTIEARSFVWGMVRKLVSAMRMVDSGDLANAALDAAKRGDERLSLPLAEPEGLILWDVEYPGTWEVEAERFTSRQRAFWELQRRTAAVRATLGELLRAPPSG